MKKIILTAAAGLLLCSVFLLQGCLKDSYERTNTYTFYLPVYQTTAEVRANIRSNSPRAIEKPGKIYVRGQYIFLNDVDRGIHVIDNSNPAAPQNVAFIAVPGCMDMAVRGNMLYADMFRDLVTIDISDPRSVVLKKIVENIFPRRYYNGYFMSDSSKIITGWQRKDTVMKSGADVTEWLTHKDMFISYSASASGTGASAAVAPYGVGGSMARFTLVNERLYTLSPGLLQVFSIADASDPSKVAAKNIGGDVETLYPFRDNLFVGSQSAMFIYSISNPDNPVQVGQFGHVRSCDPVIADDRYAYVTLRSGSVCAGFTNQMDVLSVNNLTNPSLVKTYQLTNPHGLSKDGNTLFICDGKDGLKVYNASVASDLKLIKRIGGLETYDVIASNGIALVVSTDGLYQYNYSDLNNIRLVSRISIVK